MILLPLHRHHIPLSSFRAVYDKITLYLQTTEVLSIFHRTLLLCQSCKISRKRGVEGVGGGLKMKHFQLCDCCSVCLSTVSPGLPGTFFISMFYKCKLPYWEPNRVFFWFFFPTMLRTGVCPSSPTPPRPHPTPPPHKSLYTSKPPNHHNQMLHKKQTVAVLTPPPCAHTQGMPARARKVFAQHIPIYITTLSRRNLFLLSEYNTRQQFLLVDSERRKKKGKK